MVKQRGVVAREVQPPGSVRLACLPKPGQPRIVRLGLVSKRDRLCRGEVADPGPAGTPRPYYQKQTAPVEGRPEQTHAGDRRESATF